MITLTLNTLGLIAAVIILLACVAVPADNHMGVGFMWTLFTVVLTLTAYVIGCGISAII